MDFTALLLALASDQQEMLRSILRIFHFVGLAMGLGAAILLDLMIVRFFLGRPLTEHSCQIFAFCSDIVSSGLKLLWITGIGFLVYYWFFDPIRLGNEKVWAKMVIVALLSLNGWYIHRTVLPLVYKQVGRSILQDIPQWRQQLMVSTGVVSFISWNGPLIIANLPHLNFQVPMIQILEVYLIVLVGVLVFTNLVLMLSFTGARIRRWAQRSRIGSTHRDRFI